MNFYDNIPTIPVMNTQPIIVPNDISQKINELELRIKKLEQRIFILESNAHNNNYTEPDNSLYMI